MVGVLHFTVVPRGRNRNQKCSGCNRKRRKKIYDTEKRVGFEAMLRRITESVVISKIREGDLMNSKSEWNYVCILRTVVNQASLLLRVIFHALLRSVFYFEYCDDQKLRSFFHRVHCKIIRSGSRNRYFCHRAKVTRLDTRQPNKSRRSDHFMSVLRALLRHF